MNSKIKHLSLFFLTFSILFSYSQKSIGQTYDIDYLTPKEYELGGITISGVDKLDHQVILLLTGLNIGERVSIPGDKITSALEKLWKQEIFRDIKISVDKIQGNIIFLTIHLEEYPRLSKFKFNGIKKAEAKKIREEIKITSGDAVSEDLRMNIISKINKYFAEKGYHHVEIAIREEIDSTSKRNDLILYFDITKNEKVKIEEISFKGNESISETKLHRTMKETKERRVWRFWKTSKFIEKNYEKDLDLIIEKYNEEGFRNARIEMDSVYSVKGNRINIDITIFEGQRFFFRNITWVGNTIYNSDELSRRLRINKGDPYNKSMLEENLSFDPSGMDISSLYMDNGYIFFSATPVELLVENDSIDIEIRIKEGKQARIKNISIVGNTTTNDHVILREIRTLPGQLFSRDDVMRSLNALKNLGYFNQETVTPNMIPNVENQTVDIEYHLEETSTSKVELSGGYGNRTLIGTLGLSFNNFSFRNIFTRSAWKPIPAGDGQRLSLSFQTNGTYYYAFNLSFTEPWLGGRKPNSLTVSAFYQVQNSGYLTKVDSNTYFHLRMTGLSVSLGKRLKWPDDYFTMINGLAFQRYDAQNYQQIGDGVYNNFNYNFTLGRNSLDAPIYPRNGSDLTLGIFLTPPYSFLRPVKEEEKFKWLEYYKINFRASWMFNLVGDLVFNTRFRAGFLGYYNKKIGLLPFERYYLGGDGLSGWALDGREIVPMRGYTTGALSPPQGAAVFEKYTMELRYPVSLNPSATIYVLAFAEAGYSWSSIQEFNPLQSATAAGIGVRFFMPYFGTIGLDWGYGFHLPINPSNSSKGGSQLQFSINQSID